MLTDEDKQSIKKMITEAIHPLNRKFDAVINFFDGEYLGLEKRVTRIEDLLKLKELS